MRSSPCRLKCTAAWNAVVFQFWALNGSSRKNSTALHCRGFLLELKLQDNHTSCRLP